MQLYYTEEEAYKLPNITRLNQEMFLRVEVLPAINKTQIEGFSEMTVIHCRYFREYLYVKRNRVAFYIHEAYREQVINMLLDAYNKGE